MAIEKQLLIESSMVVASYHRVEEARLASRVEFVESRDEQGDIVRTPVKFWVLIPRVIHYADASARQLGRSIAIVEPIFRVALSELDAKNPVALAYDKLKESTLEGGVDV